MSKVFVLFVCFHFSASQHLYLNRGHFRQAKIEPTKMEPTKMELPTRDNNQVDPLLQEKISSECKTSIRSIFCQRCKFLRCRLFLFSISFLPSQSWTFLILATYRKGSWWLNVFDIYSLKFSFSKKATKIWRHLPQSFDITSIKTLRTIAPIFCGLFRKAEL